MRAGAGDCLNRLAGHVVALVRDEGVNVRVLLNDSDQFVFVELGLLEAKQTKVAALPEGFYDHGVVMQLV